MAERRADIPRACSARGRWRGPAQGGWRAGQYYPGRDAAGNKLQALPALMATPAALLLEDAGAAGVGGPAEGGGGEVADVAGDVAAPHEALCFPAINGTQATPTPMA